MRQAIRTHFVPPTNCRGSRLAATAGAGRVMIAWDHELNPEENHKAAAKAFCLRFGWKPRRLSGGQLSDGSYCWVLDGQAATS